MLKYSDGVICNLKHVIVLQMGTFFSMILYHARNKGAFAFRKKLLSYSEFFDLTSKNKKSFFCKKCLFTGLDVNGCLGYSGGQWVEQWSNGDGSFC